MIIFGYPGIGKTTLMTSEDYKTNFVNGVIDLDSMFFSDLDDPFWYKRYTHLAEYISKQGYLVMISTHEKVVSSLKKSPEKKLIIVPSPDLKEKWIEKLDKRRQKTNLFKDKKAYLHVKEHFDSDYEMLLEASKWPGYDILELDSMNYSLSDILSGILNGSEVKNAG